MSANLSKPEVFFTQKKNPWRIPAFCFRFSILVVFIWLVISSIISLMIYFYYLPNNKDNLGNLVFDFSTWLFILPSIAFFGLINALPLIITWLMQVLEDDDSDEKNLNKKVENYAHRNSYYNMSNKLDMGLDDSDKI